jgi:hypothetical protein
MRLLLGREISIRVRKPVAISMFSQFHVYDNNKGDVGMNTNFWAQYCLLALS